MNNKENLLAELEKLRARVQELGAHEQVLKNTELKLIAANQQLDANNQQLIASEQQLQAINQQLQASERELKIKEAVARESQEYAENIIATVREPLVILDHDLRVVTVNRYFCTAFQVSQKETEGQLLYDLGNRQWDIPLLKKLLKQILPQNNVVEDFEIKHSFEKIGERIMLLNARELKQETNKKRLILLSIQDITQRRKKEQELQRLNAELDANKAELQQLLYITTHDLRSPLVNIQGFNKELQTSIRELNDLLTTENLASSNSKKYRLILEEEIPEALHFITSSASKMDALLTGLLVLSRLGRQKTTPKKLNINQLIEDITDTFKFELNQQKIEIIKSDLPDCFGDELQINQLFSNLIDNAIKFSDPERPGKIWISGESIKGFSQYIVEDNGIGIHPNHQKKVFELFHKLDPKKPGIGMGMNIVKQIVQSHNGKIELKSDLNIGTKFTIFIPIDDVEN